MPLQPLTPTQKILITNANEVINAVPRSLPSRQITDHTVGSAALSSTGRIITGINTFHFSGGMCAENVVFANAASSGIASLNTPGVPLSNGDKETLLCVVAVANDNRGVISPCGRCRQFMFDYYPDIRVIVQDGEEIGTVGVGELLPFAYVSGFRNEPK